MKQWIVTSMAIFTVAAAGFCHATSADNQAQKVIESWFTAMKNKQFDQAASYLAKEFVSIHTDGMVRNKSQEVTLMKNLDMQNFKLTNFKFSQSGDIITVTYKDQGTEKIDNKPIASTAAGRMAVLQNQAGKWLIIAYANLDTIK